MLVFVTLQETVNFHMKKADLSGEMSNCPFHEFFRIELLKEECSIVWNMVKCMKYT